MLCCKGVKGFSLVLAGALVGLMATSGWAWDGVRKGGVLGFGGGVAQIAHEDAGPEFFGGGFDLKVGYAFDEQWQLHYTGKTYLLYDNNVAYGLFYPQIGVQYWFRPEARSWFVAAGGGGAISGAIANTGYGLGQAGVSFFGAVGYEFARHWSLEVDLVGVRAEGVRETLYTVFATINVLGY